MNGLNRGELLLSLLLLLIVVDAGQRPPAALGPWSEAINLATGLRANQGHLGLRAEASRPRLLLEVDHIHLAVGDDPEKLVISFATNRKITAPSVGIGHRKGHLFHATHVRVMEKNLFHKAGEDYKSMYYHHVEISKLNKAHMLHYYRISPEQHSNVWSGEFAFLTPRPDASVFAILGDLGQTKYSTETLDGIRMHAAGMTNGKEQAIIDTVLIAGDLSYADCTPADWDSWFDLVQPLTARVPLMIAPGNHDVEDPERCSEITGQPFESQFSTFKTRFQMPNTPRGIIHKNTHYDFQTGVAHVFVLCPYVPFGHGSVQYNSISAALGRVDRQRTPWIIFMTHQPFYNSNEAHQDEPTTLRMREIFEPLFHLHRVDFVVAGHVHAYERSLPVYKGVASSKGTVYLNVGDGGNREGLAATFIEPKPAWSVFRQADYGFGLLSMNRTHANWTWHRDESNRFDHVVFTKGDD